LKQTLIVTLDVTATTEAQLQKLLVYLFAARLEERSLNLQYNFVNIDQEDVIAAEHALIDILERHRQKERST
jgi:hypothetical protein